MSAPPPPKAGMRGRPISKLRTIDETAEILNVSTRTVRRLIDSGALSVHRFRRLVRISDQAIRELLAGHRIKLPDGDELQPVDDIAADLLVSSRTVRRKAATVLVGGVSYARVSAIPQILADATTPKRRGRR